VFHTIVGFSGTADRLDLLPVVPNARFGGPPSWKISNDHISGQHILRNLWSCGRRCHLSQMVTVQGKPRKAHTSSPTGLSLSLPLSLQSSVYPSTVSSHHPSCSCFLECCMVTVHGQIVKRLHSPSTSSPSLVEICHALAPGLSICVFVAIFYSV